MSNKEIDITLFGATGFTGQYVFQYAMSLLVIALIDGKPFPRIAIAGRSLERLAELRERITLQCSIKSDQRDELLLKIQNYVVLIQADTGNSDSMREMAQLSKVIVNLTGPYRLLGESVVRCCVENQCDYVDITGEPEVCLYVGNICYMFKVYMLYEVIVYAIC